MQQLLPKNVYPLVPWEVAAHIGKQVKNPEWEKLSKDLVAYYPFDEGTPEGKIYYQYWSRNPYTLKILYIKADEEEAIDYLASRFDSDKFFTKINEYLYVCVENEPGV